MTDPLTDTSQIHVFSNVMFWSDSTPIAGTVVGFEDGGFIVQTSDEHFDFVAESDIRPLDVPLSL